MPKQFYFSADAFYKILATAMTLLFFHLAWICYFSDSEIWLMAMSQQISAANSLTSIYYKFFFHLVNKVSFFWATHNLEVYRASRMTFAAIGFLAACAQAQIVSQVFQLRKLRTPTFLFIISASLFFNQAFRVRADVLSLLIYSIIVLLVLNWSAFSYKRLAGLSGLQVLLLLTTPKSIIWFGKRSP